MISALLSGLEITVKYNSASPVVTQAYMVMVPKVLQSDMSGPDQSSMDALGWLVHPLYSCYYFPAETITEVANVTGEGDMDLPPFPVSIPPIIP